MITIRVLTEGYQPIEAISANVIREKKVRKERVSTFRRVVASRKESYK